MLNLLGPNGWGPRSSHTPANGVYPEWGFPHRVGRHRPWGKPCSPPVCWSCRPMEDILIRLCDRTLRRDRWVNQPQQMRHSQLRFPHRAARYRPGKSPLSTLISWRCRHMKGFLVRRLDRIIPGCHWLHRPRKINGVPGVAVATPCGAVSPRGIFFVHIIFICRGLEGFLIRR